MPTCAGLTKCTLRCFCLLPTTTQVQQTYFFRRKNENRFGVARSWTDDLLWHQLCHAIDMCYWLLDDPGLEATFAQAGPDHPVLGCPMDITIGLRSPQTGVVSGRLFFQPCCV
eukprot:SAG25_NODE_2441_length_1603_cov_1.371676_3_plen_113_part_00